MKYGFVIALLLLAGGLVAQDPEIDVQYPAGTSLSNGQTIDLGHTDEGTIHSLTITIANTGTADLTLDPDPVTVTSVVNANWVLSQPTSNTVTDTTPVTFGVDITPYSDKEWNIVFSIASDDPLNDPFTFHMKGVHGDPPEDDDDLNRRRRRDKPVADRRVAVRHGGGHKAERIAGLSLRTYRALTGRPTRPPHFSGLRRLPSAPSCG